MQAFVQRRFPGVTLTVLLLINVCEASETICASDMVSSCEEFVDQGGCREESSGGRCLGYPNSPCFIRDSDSGMTYSCRTVFESGEAFCRQDTQCVVYTPPPPSPPPSAPSPPPIPSPPPSVNFFNTEAGVAVLGSVVSAVVLSFLIYIQRRGVSARDVVAI